MPMSEPKIVATGHEDLPLREDIRLLGRILGDTVREQSGADVFDSVEYIRRNSVRFRRDEDIAARHNLETTLNSLPTQEALQIIRAFSFSRIFRTSPRINNRSARPVPMPSATTVSCRRPRARGRMRWHAAAKPRSPMNASLIFLPRRWSF